MRDLLPDFVRTSIRDRYLAGVADAEAAFEYGEADEDSLTGALGQAISTPQPITQVVDGQTFIWKIYSRKIRGRGFGAPERLYGADGIFQIEVSSADGQLFGRKGLPFQAKKGWSAADRDLLRQVISMLHATGDGIVIDYTGHGYTSCRAFAVVEAQGRKKVALKAGAVRSLGQTLGNEFLDCSIGKKGLYYNPETEAFQQKWIDHLQPRHAITTSVIKLSRRI